MSKPRNMPVDGGETNNPTSSNTQDSQGGPEALSGSKKVKNRSHTRQSQAEGS
ncbi:small acid-soluble spore protein P [Paenibacillus athensensis]|uniref:Small acid-soluble spore protein P n=1 Tax=Paenibacillus athensensis TaxID=1967502 RepID=A0A4Y8Q529_9BACL|nr:small acid-soluble spore protein P [Paenibacillus athensensis]MCD1260920.1 small acid-soluble spore protein P [Paenibacillus athensensis]